MTSRLGYFTNIKALSNKETLRQTSRSIKEKRCKCCSASFIPASGRQEYCSSECKRQYYRVEPKQRIIVCANCQKEFVAASSTSKFCCVECKNKFNRVACRPELLIKKCLCCDTSLTFENARREYCSTECKRVHLSKTKYAGVEGIDFIICPVCGQRVREMTPKHAKMHGYQSIKEMADSLGMKKTVCDAKREALKGENNPAYQHGGKFSAWSKNFIHGYDADRHEEWKRSHKEFLAENPEKSNAKIEYWLEKTNGDFEEASKLLRERQGTFSLDICVEKHGEEKGTEVWKARQEKWLKNFKKLNYSTISQVLFDELMNHLPCFVKDSVYYATYDREDMRDYTNKEYFLNLTESFVRPDFICLVNKRIIEFDGEYWHSEAVANPAREKERDEKIRNEGYDVLHVQERDFKQDKQRVIEKCVKFLTQ